MNTLRTALGMAVAAALAVGYAASQWAALHGDGASYTAALARLPMNWIALGVLVAAAAFAVVHGRKDAGEE